MTKIMTTREMKQKAEIELLKAHIVELDNALMAGGIENGRLRAVEKAARVYYHNYCQDEAEEEGICELSQQRDAQALRDALRAVEQTP